VLSLTVCTTSGIRRQASI